ncbi:MAG: LuxR C-terminal-related transcriptional regulator [Actinomycetota bacterium]|nr:LuxR C-terminal-related transcriptional regulator [Actinomycetota bacterium]
MPAYIGGPAWPELDVALARRDFPAVLTLAENETSVDVGERQLVIGICRAMFHQSEQAVAALVDSMQASRAERPARAAVAAVFLGRLHYFVHDSPSVANGWFARARRLVEDQPDCIEHALAALPLPGCDIVDVTRLHADATSALALARRLGDPNVEAKALADLGTAQVSRAFVAEGMTLLDEAMAMVLSGEASSPFAAIEVVCNLLSSCARVGDLSRADQWTRAADRHLGLGIDEGPAFLYAHCRINLGLILCDVGRWDEAEVTLRLASSRTAHAGPRVEGQVRAALAELWVLQGRLDDAERLLAGRHEHQDCLLPLAALHLARGAWADAAAVARHGIRLMGDDRVRAARLHAICVEAELASGHTEQARADADQLAAVTADHALPVLRARTELARGRVAEASDQTSAAVAAYQAGLQVLADNDWPLIRAELHLSLGRMLASSETCAAITEARAAHLTYERLGSPLANQSAQLLNTLGIEATVRPRRADATAALSRRESEVLDLLREGLSNADIAARQHNSVRTIEHHVSAILAKLGLRSRAEAAAYAASLEASRTRGG